MNDRRFGIRNIVPPLWCVCVANIARVAVSTRLRSERWLARRSLRDGPISPCRSSSISRSTVDFRPTNSTPSAPINGPPTSFLLRHVRTRLCCGGLAVPRAGLKRTPDDSPEFGTYGVFSSASWRKCECDYCGGCVRKRDRSGPTERFVLSWCEDHWCVYSKTETLLAEEYIGVTGWRLRGRLVHECSVDGTSSRPHSDYFDPRITRAARWLFCDDQPIKI